MFSDLRTIAVGLGAIALLIGVLILCNIPNLSTLGTTGGGLFSTLGVFTLLTGACLRCIKEGNEQNSNLALVYSLDVVIAYVHDARSRGIHTALFVGRTNDQPMPDEEGWVWFSLDCDVKAENSDHHLQIDFNNSGTMQNIHHLFDKVVVDYSVIKFFHDSPWDALQPLLFKHESSQLIVESDRGLCGIGNSLEIDGRRANMTKPIRDELNYYREEDKAFNEWKENIGQQKANDEYSLFIQGLTSEEVEHGKYMHHGTDHGLKLRFKRFILHREGIEPKKGESYRPQLLNAIQDYLLTLFHNVELKKTPYPYRNEEHLVEYWVASNPK